MVVVLCAEDAVAQACGIDLTVDNDDTTASPPTAATTVPHMISSNAKGADNSAATASSLVKGRRVRLRQAPPGGIMGVMPPKIAAFWKFVDGLSESGCKCGCYAQFICFIFSFIRMEIHFVSSQCTLSVDSSIEMPHSDRL